MSENMSELFSHLDWLQIHDSITLTANYSRVGILGIQPPSWIPSRTSTDANMKFQEEYRPSNPVTLLGLSNK